MRQRTLGALRVLLSGRYLASIYVDINQACCGSRGDHLAC